jgi:Secretion system C-terminal sorting domain
MKINKTIVVFLGLLLSLTISAQPVLYSTSMSPNATTGENPGLSKIIFNEMYLHGSIIGSETKITVSKTTVNIVRAANAPATTVNLWIGIDDGSGTFSINQIGTAKFLTANGGTKTTEALSFVPLPGNTALYLTGELNNGNEFSIGLEFTDDKHEWQNGGAPLSPNSSPNSSVTRVYGVDGTYSQLLSLAAGKSFAIEILGKVGATLPIELAKFTAIQTDKFQTTLAWQTASESKNQGFHIEKSLDGSIFKSIGFVKGVGNSNVSNDYGFRDNDFSKSAYFRLKQVDFDGKYSYSSTIFVERSQIGKVKTKVYPNPSVGRFYVDHATDVKNITVFNLTGQAVFNQNVNDTERTEIDISNLTTGLYFVRLNDNNGHTETKQVKIVSQ